MSAMEERRETKVPPPGRFRFTLRSLLIAMAIFGVVYGLTYPAYRAARRAAQRMQEANNLKQIGLALHNYHDANSQFPLAIARDPQGKSFLSWRVAISPYLEASNFYSQYRFNQPWDSPANTALCDQYRFRPFFAPGQPLPVRFCNIVMPVGPGTVGEQSIPLDAITDKHDETILVLALKPSDILWHEPRDLHIDEITRAPDNPKRIVIRNRLFQGALCAFVDGSVEWLPADLDYDTFRDMLTIDGGEDVDTSWRNR